MTRPNDVVRSLFAHHLWATEKLFDHLERLPQQRLDDAVPGTYGSILSTLTHLVDADGRYLLRLTTTSPPPFEDGGSRPIATLRSELDDHRTQWNGFLDLLDVGTLRASITGREDYPDTHDAEGLLLLQAIHHGNDHRTQVCSTLGALGQDVPDLDGWTYWAEGR